MTPNLQIFRSKGRKSLLQLVNLYIRSLFLIEKTGALLVKVEEKQG